MQHGKFVIFTDQRNLSHLCEQRLHTHWQQKVFTKLLGLQYEIVYKKGIDNRVADALSRKVTHDSYCAAISGVASSWLDNVAASYANDPFAKDLITKLSVNPSSALHFSFKDGLIRYKNRVWIGN
uniref:Reverse transcriptase RNase H-like domain-containing protein n=1 Tax=Arundo donax TaxID=35708 RepID=A0A0A8Z250_ARUDO